jgi:hypothetical protein
VVSYSCTKSSASEAVVSFGQESIVAFALVFVSEYL